MTPAQAFAYLQGLLLRKRPARMIRGAAERAAAARSNASADVLPILLLQYEQGQAAFWEMLRGILTRYRAGEAYARSYVNERFRRVQTNTASPEDVLIVAGLDLVNRGLR